MKKFYILCFLIGFTSILLGQEKDTQVGSPDINYRNSQTGYFNYADPSSINIKVSVWGYLKYPGKYIVPQYTTVNDLISFAGGPTGEANMDDLRIYRVLDNGKEKMVKFSYNDLMYDSKLEVNNRIVPKLEAGDILIVPGAPRLYFLDWFRVGLSIFSALISLAILVINIRRY